MSASLKILTGAVAVALTQLAAAQSSGSTQGASEARPTANAKAPEQQRSSEAKLRDVRLSQLIGRDVRDPNGQDLGDIKDLVIDLQSGQVKYAVVEFGGVMGIGEKLFAFPLSAFRQPGSGMQEAQSPSAANREDSRKAADSADRDGRRHLRASGAGLWSSRNELVLNTKKERLEKAPGFDEDRWPDFADAGYRSSIDRYWEGASGRDEQRADGGRQDRMAQGESERTRQGEKGAKPGKAGTWRASKLLDAEVVAQDGKDIGEIEDVVVNAQDGSLHYAVVAFDKGWFQADKLVSVPTDALSPRDEDELVFNGTKEQLAQAPAFDREKWPDLNEPRYRSSVDRFVGQWGIGTSPMARPGGSSAETGSSAVGGDGGSGSSTSGGNAVPDKGNPRN